MKNIFSDFELQKFPFINIVHGKNPTHLIIESEGAVVGEIFDAEYIGGVPSIIFEIGSDIDGTIQGLSGRKLDFHIRENAVIIVDNEDEYFHFDAKVEDCELCLDIYTKKGDVQHPDLYASKLLKATQSFFEGNNYFIHFSKTMWIDGTNLEQYWGNIDLGCDKESAALNTWEGRMNTNILGMNRALVMDNHLRKVEVIYYKDLEV